MRRRKSECLYRMKPNSKIKITSAAHYRNCSVFPRLVLACLRSLLTCLQRKIQCQQNAFARGKVPGPPTMLRNNVVHNAIDRRLGVNKMFCCMVLPVCQ